MVLFGKLPLIHICLVLCTLLLGSCAQKPTDVTKTGQLPPIFPDYIDVTVPAEIAPLNFDVDGAQAVYVVAKGENGGELTANGKYADFSISKWHELLTANTGADITISVCAKIDGKWLQYDDFAIHVSQQPLEQWGLTYRRIAPGYEVYSKMGLYQRDLSNFDERPIIENTQTSGQCYNCHTANKTNPEQFVFHVRGDHGATMIQQQGEQKWLKAVNDSLGGSLVYPYWHPSGRYCAFSTNQTRQAFHIAHSKRLEVFDLSSDVVVLDVDNNVIILDSLLSLKGWAENTPAFSPDGKTLYFTSAVQQQYPSGTKQQQYNLCSIAFDESTGRFGQRVDTLFDAVSMGKSVTWPRPSYDGRYLLFTISDYGYFSIWHKESDQWLLDLQTGEAKPLEAANSDDADSFHNWSANSRWIVFTSRRHDGLYSQLYIAYISPEGVASKPFLLPQRDPRAYYDNTLFSFNTPDFSSTPVPFSSHSSLPSLLSPTRIPTTLNK